MTTRACPSTLCERIINRVELRVGREPVHRFLRGSTRIELDDEGVSISAPSAFLAECITRRFGEALRDAAREEMGDTATTVRVGVHQTPSSDAHSREARQGAGRAERVSEGASAPARRVAPTPARQRRLSRATPAPMLSLDAFVVGPCNQLAYSAAVTLTQTERPQGFNVVFIHGECGVGKTHLLQGVADRHRNANPTARILYTTGESFTNTFVTAIRKGDAAAFRRKHRGLDLLCIDDIHFLSNKTATQAEFLHTFNAMDLDGARIMLASDEHPARIRQFSRELVSRFSAGMVVELGLPDPVTRRRIIASLARRRGLALTEEALTAIAERRQGSVRQIEGALTRLDAMRRLLPQAPDLTGPIDAADVHLALGPARSPRARRPIKVQLIAETISGAVGVSMPELLGRCRHKRVVIARSMTAHLARRLTSCSYPEIAQAMGRPNHSTIVTAHKRVERKIASGEPFDADLDVPASTWGELADELRRRVLSAAGAL